MRLMHKTIRLASTAAAIAAAVALSASANAATTTGSATAEILSALSVSQTQGLDFAQIAVNGAGTVTIGTGATPVDTCSAALVCAGAKQQGAFLVTGAPGIGVTASVREASITIRDGGGTGPNSMTVGSFTLYWPNGTTLAAGTGQRQFVVGGTLTVGAAQATGVYTGTYNVDVAYN